MFGFYAQGKLLWSVRTVTYTGRQLSAKPYTYTGPSLLYWKVGFGYKLLMLKRVYIFIIVIDIIIKIFL